MKKAILLTVALLVVTVGGVHLYRDSQIRQFQNEIIELCSRLNYLSETYSLKRKAVEPLERLVLDAEKDGMCLIVKSGYRTYEKQKRLYEANTDGLVAKPGTSEHELGIAVDFDGCPMKDGKRDDSAERLELRNEFSTLPEYQWLKENAHRYGFEQSYTEENAEETGIPAEPWHWRYIGK